MIKACELRIGNWIDEHQPFQVDSYDIAAIEHDSMSKSPIPLTEEWLLKLGFKKTREKHFIEYKYGMSIFYTENGSQVHCGEWTILLRSVHQLQNLYFALTGQELTLEH